jgi:hypothetical protein
MQSTLHRGVCIAREVREISALIAPGLGQDRIAPSRRISLVGVWTAGSDWCTSLYVSAGTWLCSCGTTMSQCTLEISRNSAGS